MPFMTTEESATLSLSVVLAEQIGCAESILEALDREHEALLSGNADTLNQAGDQKTQLVEILELLERQRRDLVDLQPPPASPAPDNWQRLLGLLEHCRERNHRNGILLNARRTQVMHALGILQGHESLIYGSAGVGQRSVSSSTLARA
jgi:flagellar biosynthesis/type III secretory pathway chaperone